MAENQLVVRLEPLAHLAQHRAAFLDVGRRALPEDRAGEQRLAGRRSRHDHEFAAQIHQLQVEVVARRRTGVGADAETLLADVALRVGADDVDQEQVLAALLVVDVAELAPEVEPVEVPDARDVAGADAEDGALAARGRSARSGAVPSCRRMLSKRSMCGRTNRLGG